MRDESGQIIDFDVIVSGAGPAGLAAAAALRGTGLRIAACGYLPSDTPAAPDNRTAALFSGSVGFLKHLGVWQAIEPHSVALHGIRIVDDTSNLLRAPETLFHASDIGQPDIGFNCPNPAIVTALAQCLDRTPTITTFLGRRITAISATPDGAEIMLAPAGPSEHPAPPTTLRSRLLIGADGRGSLARHAAAIKHQTWDYRQTALTLQFRHTRPHQGISTEFHRDTGPFTVVPLPGYRSALVWLDRHAAIRAMARLSRPELETAIAARLHGLLGEITVETPARTFAMTGLLAERMGHNRVALVGETAHAFPPIGAQGLNLSLRDVRDLAATIRETQADGGDIGGPAALESYDRRRRADVATRVYGVDMLGASLTSAFLPLPLARGAILHAMKLLPAARNAMFRQVLGQSAAEDMTPITRPLERQ
jgi:2-octaprenyl-6-methoxyphenol hydroxylase